MKLFRSLIVRLKRNFKRWERHLVLDKRQQFVAITLILTAGLMLTQLVASDLRYLSVIILSVITYFLSAFGLREDLKGIEWFTLLTLPTIYTFAVALFYFLLPARWLTRLPVAALYAIGIYALLLTENIYNVAANRTIGLLRAAQSVGFLMTVTVYFFLSQSILAFRYYPLANIVWIILVSAILYLPLLWSMELTPGISRRVRDLTLTLTLIEAEIMWILSFWPVTTTQKAILMAGSFYALGGMGQLYLSERLYKKNIWELFIVILIITVVVFLTTNWRGVY